MTTASAPKPKAAAAVVWIGPAGHHSEAFGDLVPGKTYHTADHDLARVLVAKNGAFWRAPEAPAAPVKE